jgi:hypothetical protein
MQNDPLQKTKPFSIPEVDVRIPDLPVPASLPVPVQAHPADRMTPAEVDALRAKLIGNGVLVAVLEAIDEAVFLFLENGQLLHANAEALKTVDHVGIQSAAGITLSELLGCTFDQVSAAGCGTSTPCRNCEAIRTLLGAFEGKIPGKPVALLLEQSAQSYLGKFRVKASSLSVDGLRLHLLILQQTSLVKRSAKVA